MTQLSRAPLLPVLGLTTVLFGVLVGRTITATTLLIPVVRPKQRGAFLSLDAAVQQLAAGVATYGTGLLVANTVNGTLLHYEWAGYLAAVTSGASFFLVRRLLGASRQRLRGAASKSAAELATLTKAEIPVR